MVEIEQLPSENACPISDLNKTICIYCSSLYGILFQVGCVCFWGLSKIKTVLQALFTQYAKYNSTLVHRTTTLKVFVGAM